jgi:hypothetical protein
MAPPLVALPLDAEAPVEPAAPLALPAAPPLPAVAAMPPPVPAAPAPPMAAPPLALPALLATLPMFETELPDTLPLRFEVAVAVEVLYALATLELADPPLLAAAAPTDEADEPPLLLLLPALLSLFWFELLSVRELLSLLSVLVVVVAVAVLLLLRVLLSLLSVLVVVVRALLSVWVLVAVLLLSLVLLLVLVLVLVLLLLLSVVRVLVWVAVLPPRARFESSAWALSEKASEIAVTSKVLFIRIPLWVLVGDGSAVAPTTFYLHNQCQLHNRAR